MHILVNITYNSEPLHWLCAILRLNMTFIIRNFAKYVMELRRKIEEIDRDDGKMIISNKIPLNLFTTAVLIGRTVIMHYHSIYFIFNEHIHTHTRP